MNALDKRLSLPQPSSSAGPLASNAVSAQRTRGRKIAPTRIQLEPTGSSFPRPPQDNIAEAGEASFSDAFGSTEPKLMAEASTRDLCSSNEGLGEKSCCISLPHGVSS